MELEVFVPQTLWVAQMPLRTYGLEVGTRMTVCRLSSGDLWVHSPVRPDEKILQQLKALGTVRFIVAPVRQHHFFIRDFVNAYPSALLFGSPDLPPKLPDLHFDGVLGSPNLPQWNTDIESIPIRGNLFHDEVVFFHRTSRTLIVADLCICGHPKQPPFTRLGLWLAGVYQKPGPMIDVKLAYVDKSAARASIEKVMQWDFDKMILSHGHLIESGAREVVYQAYRFLLE